MSWAVYYPARIWLELSLLHLQSWLAWSNCKLNLNLSHVSLVCELISSVLHSSFLFCQKMARREYAHWTNTWFLFMHGLEDHVNAHGFSWLYVFLFPELMLTFFFGAATLRTTNWQISCLCHYWSCPIWRSCEFWKAKEALYFFLYVSDFFGSLPLSFKNLLLSEQKSWTSRGLKCLQVFAEQ